MKKLFSRVGVIRQGDEQRSQKQQALKYRTGDEKLPGADALRHRIAPGDEDIGDSSPAVQKQQQPHGNTLYLPLGDPQYHSHQADDTDDKGNNEDGYLQLAAPDR